MDSVTASTASDVDYFVDAEVAFARCRGADGIGFVGKPNVERFAVDFTEYGDGADAKFAAGAQDAHGDLTTIGNQDFLEHELF